MHRTSVAGRRLLGMVVLSVLGTGLTGCSQISSLFGGSTSAGPQPDTQYSQTSSPAMLTGGTRPPGAEATPASMNTAGTGSTAVAQPASTRFPQASGMVSTGLGEAALRQHTFVAEGADADVTVDPSGKWIAYTSTRHSERAKLYLQRVDGVAVMQLTGDESDDAQPAFSPDGKRLAFASNRSGKWAIYVMDVDGKNLVQMTGLGGYRGEDLHPSWSPDGTQLAFCSLSAKSGAWEIWIVDVVTGARRVIGEGMFPSWCPERGVNGAGKIAFQRARQRGSKAYSIWTVEVENGEPHAVTEVAWSGEAAFVTPGWSSDGKKLVFTAMVRGESNAGGGAGGQRSEVWVVDWDGTNRRKLTEGGPGAGIAVSPTWARDGRVYFVSDRGGNEAVWSVSPGSGVAGGSMAERRPEELKLAEGKSPEGKSTEQSAESATPTPAPRASGGE